jgi:hypothetical protein
MTGLQMRNERSADAAVDRLNVAVSQTIYLAAPSGHIQTHKCPAWFSGNLKAYIKKKNIYSCRRYKKFKTVSTTNLLLTGN